MSAKHSPGPWQWRMNPDGYGYMVYSESADELIMSGVDVEADARLIAAAPELMEALRAVLKEADRDTESFIAARALIARVEGEG